MIATVGLYIVPVTWKIKLLECSSWAHELGTEN